MGTKFWSMKSSGKRGELFLYGEISDSSWFEDEVTPATFQKDLSALGDIDTLEIYINSPGGDAFAGVAIYHALKRHKAHKRVHIDGIAASAASVVAMAGDEILMPKAATMMIHNAWALAIGNKERLMKVAAALERMDAQLAGIYGDRTGRDLEAVAAWMTEERWMNGEEAVQDGFADTVELERIPAAASADAERYFSLYRNAPALRAGADSGTETETETETDEGAEGGTGTDDEDGDRAEDGNASGTEADNGAETQPVAGIQGNGLREQRQRMKQLRLKLLEVHDGNHT